MKVDHKRNLIEDRMADVGLEQFVIESRDSGASWDKIATELSIITKVYIYGEWLRRRFSRYENQI